MGTFPPSQETPSLVSTLVILFINMVLNQFMLSFPRLRAEALRRAGAQAGSRSFLPLLDARLRGHDRRASNYGSKYLGLNREEQWSPSPVEEQ